MTTELPLLLIFVAANHVKFPLAPERDNLLKSDNGPMLMEGIETGMEDMFPPVAIPMPGEVGPLFDLSSLMSKFNNDIGTIVGRSLLSVNIQEVPFLKMFNVGH